MQCAVRVEDARAGLVRWLRLARSEHREAKSVAGVGQGAKRVSRLGKSAQALRVADCCWVRESRRQGKREPSPEIFEGGVGQKKRD